MIKLILSVMACLMFMTGCNTVEGVGQDVESGGRAIESGAAAAK